jgi:ribosomal protein S18 acetylase RimI-like enzyme
MFGAFELKDGRIVLIKHLMVEDYEYNNNYEFVHNWLHRVNKYLAFEFEKEDLVQDKKSYYDILSNEKDNFVIGALFDDMIIASANLSMSPHFRKEKHIGRWGIAIHPDFQNQGLGTKLLKIIEKIAMEKGLKKLEAEYFDRNKNAEILYLKKMNYIIEGRRKFSGLLKDGKYADKILIGKIIDKALEKYVKK